MDISLEKTYRHDFLLKDYGFPEVPLFGAYRAEKAFKELNIHTHDAFEVCFLVEGRQNYSVAGRDFLLRSGDIFITKPGELHSSGKQPQEKGALYWVHFTPPPKGRSFLGLEAKFGEELLRQLGDIRERRFAGSTNILRLLKNVHMRLMMPKTWLGVIDIGNSLTAVLLETIRCASSPESREPNNMNSIIGYINKNIEQPLRVPELSARMKLSESWFKARFKNETGLSPAEYVLRLRVRKAREFLEAGQGNVTDAAYKFGFSSSQHFATAFKKFTNLKPSELKKKGG